MKTSKVSSLEACSKVKHFYALRNIRLGEIHRMKNTRIDLYKLLLFLLIIILIIPYAALAQENETKITNQENIITTLQNATFTESSLKSDSTKEDNTIKILILGWFLGIMQPFIINPIKKKLDKRNFKQIVKNDLKNITNHLKSKKQSLLDFSRDNTLDDAIQRYANPAEVTPSMRLFPEITMDFYLKNYTKFLEYFNGDEFLINFYLRIQTLNSLGKTITEQQDIRDNGYRLLFLAYLTHLKEALREGENISI